MPKDSETRTLLVILGVVAVLCCGCMCVPLALLGVGLGVPAVMQVQKAAQTMRPPLEAPAEEPATVSVLPNLPGLPPDAIGPPAPPTAEMPPLPAKRPPRPSAKPVAPKAPPAKALAALSQRQRQQIYSFVIFDRELRHRMTET